MVSHRALLTIRAALDDRNLAHQRDICDRTGYTLPFVQKALSVLVDLGVVERVIHDDPIPSGKKYGSYKVAYRLIAIK